MLALRLILALAPCLPACTVVRAVVAPLPVPVMGEKPEAMPEEHWEKARSFFDNPKVDRAGPTGWSPLTPEELRALYEEP